MEKAVPVVVVVIVTHVVMFLVTAFYVFLLVVNSNFQSTVCLSVYKAVIINYAVLVNYPFIITIKKD